jgi:hypothetical protein
MVKPHTAYPRIIRRLTKWFILFEEKELPPCFVKGKKEPILTTAVVSVKV